MHISKRAIHKDTDVYFVAELSANHAGSLETALKTVQAAKESGADAIKLQTYTADTMTLCQKKPPFVVDGGTPWDGRTLYELYQQAHTPWEWHEKIQKAAQDLDLDFFSAAFDPSAVDFLEKLNVPVHKVASFELTDLPLIKKMAATKKPVILSTGMATEAEILEAVATLKNFGCNEYMLLKCTSAYPAPIEEAHLLTIPYMETSFHCPIGLSDHTMGVTVPIVAAALGSCLIEKHLILSRAISSPDSSFSLEPHDFRMMVQNVRLAKKSLGSISFGATKNSVNSLRFRRSLWVTKPVKKGEKITKEHIKPLRPAMGLAPKHLDAVLGKIATEDLPVATPVDWNIICEKDNG